MTMKEVDHIVIKPSEGAKGNKQTLAQQESGAPADTNPHTGITVTAPGDAAGLGHEALRCFCPAR